MNPTPIQLIQIEAIKATHQKMLKLHPKDEEHLDFLRKMRITQVLSGKVE